MGCDLRPLPEYHKCRYFNPRTPVGCDLHRPRRARARLDFNPRTPVGCDSTSAAIHPHTTDFNPRTPVGCDHRELAYPPAVRISIHAPLWGATDGGESEVVFLPISIHAPQWGATIGTLIDGGRAAQFQSTHPSGVRRSNLRTMGRAPYFNPRTPVGCDSPAPQATTYR